MSRYLVLSELFLPTRGGTAVWAAEVYKRLGGKEIHIVTADVPGAAADVTLTVSGLPMAGGAASVEHRGGPPAPGGGAAADRAGERSGHCRRC